MMHAKCLEVLAVVALYIISSYLFSTLLRATYSPPNNIVREKETGELVVDR